MRKLTAYLAIVPALLLLGGCASVPTGPSTMSLPGTGKNFDEFRSDDSVCRQYAYYQIGGVTAEQAQVDAGVQSAVVGTLIGALAGAAVGGRDGAAVGAGTGLLIGSMAGSGAAQGSVYGTQRQYDNAYTQCMYAKGHQVAVPGIPHSRGRTTVYRGTFEAPGAVYPPPPGQMLSSPEGGSIPPPPPGTPPPPPPGVP